VMKGKIPVTSTKNTGPRISWFAHDLHGDSISRIPVPDPRNLP
jgi:hypothetical protein